MKSDKKLVIQIEKNETLGDFIQKCRQQYGWTQEELGCRADITREHVGRIERDKCVPSVLTINSLEKAFHLPPMSLVRLKLNPEIQLFSDSEEEKCVGYACKKLEYSLVANLTKTDMLKACDVISTISELISHNGSGSENG